MDTFSKSDFDIVIVGAGIVGATLASLLKQRAPDLSIAIVDAGPAKSYQLEDFDPRVIAVSKASEAIFRDLGVWEAVLAIRACAYFDMRVWDGDGTRDIHFDCADIDSDNLGHIVENSILNSVLLEQLASARQLEIAFGVKVESVNNDAIEGRRSLQLSNQQSISAPLIIATDGANSPLREMLDFPMRQWEYGQQAIVTTVRTSKAHQNTAWQRFAKTGPLAFLPLTKTPGDQQHCSIVWSLDTAEAQRIMDLNTDDFNRQLTQTFEERLGSVEQLGERLSFPLVQRHATEYSKAGVILVGDSAHTIHPLAGQGANLGIYDAEVLASEIQRAVERGLVLSDGSIARRYERKRQVHNLVAMSTMEGFKRLFGSDNLALRWLRNEGLRAVSQNSWLKNKLSRIASGHL